MKSHEEIVMDILNRLSVKSLTRFKCVSKFWNNIISQPYFKKMHLNTHVNHHNSPKKFLIDQYECFHMSTTFNVYSFSLSNSAPQLIKDIRRLDTPTSFEPKWGRVYCCCDGLFFIGVWRELDEGRHPSLLLLWNPSTGESVKLPTQYPQSSPKQHLYGIGYDPTSDDYKIIRIDWNKNVPDEILALKSGSWRKIGEYAGGINGVHWTSPMKLCLAFVEGAFHWLGREKDCVVSFNISNEIYGEIPLPVTPYSNRIEEKRVSAVGRRVYYHHDDEINFNLWVMKDYGMKESWTKLFSIQSHGEGIMAPIYRFSNDEVLLSCYGLKGSIYKTSNGSSNRTWPLHLNDISDLKRTIDGFVYTESLISPKLDNI
ncbi:F-box/kelch-repeat protein At3g06240-like [Capsicum annuum]|uniref:F-box/kelch-repeat protein At3g06240-like n=1 Tax=Capsicum annuum TaxID=4072 RepID=UPI001FB0B908|nr:F-box/kelch-repeat protein At3g06240-like [Capsicum annuum]